jgi:HSP20 family protein
MTTITRWDPFRELVEMQNRLNTIFREPASSSNELMTSGAFVPPVDIYADEQKIVLKVELPGMSEKDIDIQLENHTLTLRGERKVEKEEKEENFVRIERRYGSFQRSFTLPETVDPESVNAVYENGVLKIELAKREQAKPKQIKVRVAEPQTLTGDISMLTARK